MDPARIAELLQLFLGKGLALKNELSPAQLHSISIYIDILLRWNARINLTAIRHPEEIVTRHFGESLFAALHLFPAPERGGGLIDLGSGAGFPGIPIKLWAPNLHVTLIESNQKKATFLREVCRNITLTGIDVFPGRAEDFPGAPQNTVTLRAVERFESAISTASRLLEQGGRLALLIGEKQVATARRLAQEFEWSEPHPIPASSSRVLFIGRKTNHVGQAPKL